MAMEWEGKFSQFNQLPELVKTHICTFLDPKSLTNLRRTCKSLKATVEQTSILPLIPIKLTNSKRLQQVLQSQVRYSNFVISFQNLDEQSYFGEFIEKFGGQIRTLSVKSKGGDRKIISLLVKCKKIKELTLEGISASSLSISKDELEALLFNIRNLRKLSINELQSHLLPGKETLTLFLQIVGNCQNLREFNIPQIAKYNEKLMRAHRLYVIDRQPVVPAPVQRVVLPHEDLDDDDWEWEQDLVPPEDPFPEWNPMTEKDILIHGIIDYIRSRSPDSTKLERIHINSISQFHQSSFFELIQICEEYGIKLCGLTTAQLTDISTEFTSLTPKLLQIFETIKLTHVIRGFPLNAMSSLKDLDIVLHAADFHATSGWDFADNNSLELPNLESLRANFMSWSDTVSKNKLLLTKLFAETERPLIKKLHLEWFYLRQYDSVSAKDLSCNFKNVTELCMVGWDGNSDDFITLWSNLEKLEKVTLKECKYLSNRAFVGDFTPSSLRHIRQRPFNRLKKLRYLTIRDSSGHVDDMAIVGSFRWIPLFHFEFDSVIRSRQRMDWDLYNNLASTRLGKSVESLIVPNPYHRHRYLNERNVMRKFRNLKYHRLI